jgi:hypothetical protein
MAKGKRTPGAGGVCIVCGEFVFSAEGLAQHYKDRHMGDKR